MSKIVTSTVDVHTTTDGQQFDRLHKAEAHQAEVDIRAMVEEHGVPHGCDIEDIMGLVRHVFIYVPDALWKDMLK